MRQHCLPPWRRQDKALMYLRPPPTPKAPEHTLWGLSSSSTCEMMAGGIKGLNAGSLELDAGCNFTLIDCGGWKVGVKHVSVSPGGLRPQWQQASTPPPMAGPTHYHPAHKG